MSVKMVVELLIMKSLSGAAWCLSAQKALQMKHTDSVTLNSVRSRGVYFSHLQAPR